MSHSGRPLSPHLQIFRWPITMLLSILHRVTGVARQGRDRLVSAGRDTEPFVVHVDTQSGACDGTAFCQNADPFTPSGARRVSC